MYAVVKTGGKQYRVEEGETIQVEKLEGNPGDTVELDEVLMISYGETFSLGRPLVAGAKVTAEIVAQDRAPKVIVYKYRRRKRYRRKSGHRQPFTALRITGIQESVGRDAPAPEA
jgi:large subunit ribosomal protein L21